MGGGWGEVRFYPYTTKGDVESVLAILKGYRRTSSHPFYRGRGHNKFYPVSREGGRAITKSCNFPIL